MLRDREHSVLDFSPHETVMLPTAAAEGILASSTPFYEKIKINLKK